MFSHFIMFVCLGRGDDETPRKPRKRKGRRGEEEDPHVIVVTKGNPDDDSPGRRSRASPTRNGNGDQEIQDEDDNSDSRKRQQIDKPSNEHPKDQEDRNPATNRSKQQNDNEIPVDENANRAKSDTEDKKPKEKKKQKGKLAIIHKTKLERQISNKDHVLEKYELGKTLGDGNFAIVRQCKLKNTPNEYAMKVIDKPKLRGKEHMIENEINIMKVCSHPNICKLIEEFETKSEIYLCMELVKVSSIELRS